MNIYRDSGVFFEMYKAKPAPVVMFGAGERGKIWSKNSLLRERETSISI